jgi:hypothetical protein
MNTAVTHNGENHSSSESEKMKERKPRICMLTTRGFARNAFRCGGYEGQDALRDIDDVDLIYLKPKKHYSLLQPLQKQLIWHDVTRKVVTLNMIFEPVTLTRDYDLFIAWMPLMQDLLQLSAVHGWRDHCKKSICWIDEIYSANVPSYKAWLSILKDFDHVALGLHGTVDIFEKASKRPCHFMPGAVDTLRFAPYPYRPARVIDVYSMGRINKELNQAFREMEAKNGMFYVHDTFMASEAQAFDPGEHREMLASMAKRSLFMFVAPAKMNVPEETKGQIEIGYRYYEAAAAGAVMIGQAPDCESFRAMFDWQDAVIEILPDGSNAAEILSGLAEEPERMLRISRRNTMEALLRHDWVYRWKRIFEIVGLQPAPELEIRINTLKRIAEEIGSDK